MTEVLEGYKKIAKPDPKGLWSILEFERWCNGAVKREAALIKVVERAFNNGMRASLREWNNIEQILKDGLK